jgi:biopolymer transport protein ExbB
MRNYHILEETTMSRTIRACIALFVSLTLFAAIPALMSAAKAQQQNAPAQETVKTGDENTPTGDPGENTGNGQGDTTMVAGDPTEAAESTNLFSTVRQGGPVMIPIILLGLLAMTIIVERMIFFTRNRVWKRESVDGVLDAAKTGSKAKYREDLEDELRSAFNVYANDLEKGLGLLAGVGNLAPIFGFLGTVTGMISAFAAIAAASSVNAKVVASGIQEALITTAGGLMVAAPTLFFYYVFTNAIQNFYTRSEEYIGLTSDGLPRLSDKIKNGE